MTQKNKSALTHWPIPLDIAWSRDGRFLIWQEKYAGIASLWRYSLTTKSIESIDDSNDIAGCINYGGAGFDLGSKHIYFSTKKSGALYQCSISQPTTRRRISPEQDASLAAPTLSPDEKHLLYLQRTSNDVDSLCIASTQSAYESITLHDSCNFYMQPCFSPNQQWIAWCSWQHPNMPFVASKLYLAKLHINDTHSTAPKISNIKIISNADSSAVFQPIFAQDSSRLYYCCDSSGWSNICSYSLNDGQQRHELKESAEHSRPAWLQGMRTMALDASDTRLWYLRNAEGHTSLNHLNTQSAETSAFPGLQHFSDLTQIAAHPSSNSIAMIAHSSSNPAQIIIADHDRQNITTLPSSHPQQSRRSTKLNFQHISFSVTNTAQSHGFYLPAPRAQGEKQHPLLIMIHSGPTTQQMAVWSQKIQNYHEQGYAIFLPNYRGSTGYGRRYMMALQNQWGNIEVEDIIAGWQYLNKKYPQQFSKIALMGGSAGGFTALRCLIEHPDLFACAALSYPLSDLSAGPEQTHKFEQHYNDFLLGAPNAINKTIEKRSPLLHAARIQCPLLLFHGKEDCVVDISQSDALVEQLRQNHVDCDYHIYADEGHGFRNPENIIHQGDLTSAFLAKHTPL
ncbi:MAG TPA: S9 family peptidase [Flavobacteriales bacterium]|nr:S9 family peptidase [Flavobacteriales bacterium]